MSNKITHWVQLLDEVGQPLLNRASNIVEGQEDRELAYKSASARIERLEEDLFELVRKNWTIEQITAAKLDYFRNYHEGKIEPEGIHMEEDAVEWYTLPGGRKIHIGRYDLGFVRSLRKLPPSTKASILRLTPEDMSTLIIEETNRLREDLIELLSKPWHWRESGDKVAMNSDTFTEYFLQIDCSITALKKRIKADKIPYTEMLRIQSLLTSDRSEVYIPEKFNQ